MTGLEYQKFVCDELKDNGFWALDIPRNKRGAQPFDIIALRGKEVITADCKVCSTSTFPVSRVEDNQWLAFEAVRQKTDEVKIGLFVYCEETMKQFFIPYSHLEMARDNNCASIKLTEIYAEMFLGILK